MASAILSFSASAAEPEYSAMTGMLYYKTKSAFSSSSPQAVCTFHWPGSFAFQNANGSYRCGTTATSTLVNPLGSEAACPDPFVRNSSEPANSAQACIYTPPPGPCEEQADQEYTFPFYAGDTSSSTSADDTISPPSKVCQNKCVAILTNSGDGCYSRAYLSSDDKFGQSAIFCTATYLTIDQECTPSDDPANPPPPDAPTDPEDPDTPIPTKPTDQAPSASPDAPEGDDGPPPGAPSCPPGTYAVQTSGGGWICNSFDNPHPRPDEEGCPPGTQAGTVNGVLTCMAGGPSSPGPNAPGSGTPGVGGSDDGDSDGDGGAALPGSGADSGGSVGGGGGGGAGQGVGETSIGVECETEPVCTGDPLLCALQIQEWRSSCEIQKAIASPLDDQELEKWKNVGTLNQDSPEIGAATDRVDTMLTGFASRLSFSTSGCPSDFTIQVMGRSISVAISSACGLLKIMKMLIFMGAYLFCARLLWSSVI